MSQTPASSPESFGKYILLEKIQTGGMAEIYLARSPGASGVSKLVAIKRILPQFSEQTEFIDMFKDEAKIAVNLSHANIVSIHEFGVERNQFFLTMDYVEGRNLRQILTKMKKSGVTFSTEQVLYVIKEVAAGLDHAHRCIDSNTGRPLNIIHRDMSPQNVMVSFEGEVKVVDFGIAKAETQLETTRAGTLKGKFGYMSPEQAEGQNVDLRTDIFALGIVLWELLANDRLFVANNEVNTLRKVRDCQIPSLRKINPNIPQELERIVSKALAKDRNLRYQTAAAFHRELSRFLNRQYPDFSPHDFSVFIKTLFASEILESRKKMVQYAKIEFPKHVDTSSSDFNRPDFTGERSGGFTSSSTLTENTEADFTQRQPEPRASSRSDRQQEAPKKKSPPPPPPAASASVKAKPSGKKKQAESMTNLSLSVDRSSYFERTGTSPGTRPDIGSGGTHYSTRTHSGMTVRSSFAPRVSLPVALIAVAILAGSWAFYQNDPSMPLRMMAAIGLGNKETQASKRELLTDASPGSTQKYDVAVSSNPSGADILVDGAAVGEITPTVLRLPQDKLVKISVNLRGYIPIEKEIKVDGTKSLNMNLVPEKIAYLDILVAGAGEIRVDGKLVARGSPAYNVPIKADTDVIVRAEDPSTRAFDEVKIRLGADEKKKITLIPRAMRSGASVKTK